MSAAAELKRIATQIADLLDADQDLKALKLASALCGRLPRYRADVDALLMDLAAPPPTLIAEGLLKRLVIGWDADQDEEFTDALRDARELLGLTLAEDADHVLTQLQLQHDADRDDDDDDQETAL